VEAIVPYAQNACSLQQLLAGPALQHSEVLDGISTHFAGGSSIELDELLNEASRRLFGLAGAPLDERTSALTSLLFETLGLRAETADFRGLLTRTAIAQRSADPLVIAMLGHELCRRAGVTSRVCVTETGAWTGLLGDEEFSLVGGLPFDGDPGDLRLACAHESAYLLLERLRWTAPGPFARCAENLRTAMCERRELEHDCLGHHCFGRCRRR
jgi:hypothetical protein